MKSQCLLLLAEKTQCPTLCRQLFKTMLRLLKLHVHASVAPRVALIHAGLPAMSVTLLCTKVATPVPPMLAGLLCRQIDVVYRLRDG